MKNLLLVFIAASIYIVSCAQNGTEQLKTVEQKLSVQAGITEILTDPSYMQLHSQTAFRELIKQHAKQEIITLVTYSEPGTPVTIKGKVVDKNNKPSGDVLVYVYHTDNKGWYSDTEGHVTGMGGDRNHARLFGYFKTNNDGSFEFHTIHPQGYPNSDLPQHIHFEVYSNTGQALLITELLFSEDKRLTASMRTHMLNEGAFIASNTGTSTREVYEYIIKIR